MRFVDRLGIVVSQAGAVVDWRTWLDEARRRCGPAGEGAERGGPRAWRWAAAAL